MTAPPLIARIRERDESLATGPGADDHRRLPTPLAGFRQLEPSAVLELSRHGQPLGAIPLRCVERRMAGQLIARGALVGTLPPGVDPDEAYRAILDVVLPTSTPPHVITFDAEGPEESVDALWRLALAVDAACVIREEDGARQVDLLLEGRRARLALALAQRPWPRRSDLAGVFRRLLRRARDERLLILARDLRDGPPSVKPNAVVEFTEATEAEVRRHPRRFGLRLSATAPKLPGARQFVGRLHGRAVYRMVCTPAPPVLEHLDRAMLDRLAAPRALVSDCYTDPQWRGESIYPAALQWLARWAAERDIRTLVLLVRADNEASIRGAKKAGFELRGEASSSAR